MHPRKYFEVESLRFSDRYIFFPVEKSLPHKNSNFIKV